MNIEKEKSLYKEHVKEKEPYANTKISIEYNIKSLQLVLAKIRYETDASPIREEITRLEEIIFAWDFPDKLKG